MPKKNAAADELIWLFHVKLADANFNNAGIAIVPGSSGGWTALTSAKERKRYPKLASRVARIEKTLQGVYNLKQE